ncbi:MAG: AAA family ATPase [Prochlorococcaceae cyanobacterium]
MAPQWRSPPVGQRACLFLDEIQLIAGWEGFVRRVIDSEPIDVVITGSSAQMLSACTVYPFSFREVLRHQGLEPEPGQRLSSAQRSRLQQALLSYLTAGGFPEAQGLDARFRAHLLAGYVDSTVLRDVIERHNVSRARPERRPLQRAQAACRSALPGLRHRQGQRACPGGSP